MPNRKKFEYLETILTVRWELQSPDNKMFKPEKLLITQLNELGDDGWELIRIEEVPVLPKASIYTVIFKREKLDT